MTALSIVQRSLLEKVARDNGFDVPEPGSATWLPFSSTEVPLRVWLGADAELFVLAVSSRAVAGELQTVSTAAPRALPEGAVGVLSGLDHKALHHVVRRAFQLSATLPDALHVVFERATKNLPRATEAERLVIQRVGQSLFRDGLLRYWQGRCAVTDLAVPELLRASHIKPWACATDTERLDVYNGLLLAPQLDAAFDLGFISFENDGSVAIADSLQPSARLALGIAPTLRLSRLADEHRFYLAWHRAEVFRAPKVSAVG